MLQKPAVPLCPVTVKDMAVVAADWFVAMKALDIWELVTFPLIATSTVAPLAVFTCTVSGACVGEGVAIGVGVGAGIGVDVGVGVDTGLRI